MGSEQEALNALKRMAEAPKTLVIDIETMAPLVYTWTLRKANIGLNQIVKPGRVICFAAKWHGTKGAIEFRSEHHDGHDQMISAAHGLINEADVVVGYNSDRFDMRHLNREFKQAGFDPPRGYRTIDLMKAWNKKFVTSSGSRKLDAVLMELGLERKLDTGGFELWFDCDRGDEKAWRLMKQYCRHDVKCTAAALDELSPWITPFPHQGLYGGPRAGCPRCGSMEISQDGHVTTSTGRYLNWRCGACGGTHKGTHRVEAVHHAAN